ncbi:MAG: glycosyltransferase family 2 protein [Halobacteriovoraceae bacterium]|nr:glycosyltransferase family 2 protein [Halobacteriovoraceae bacterium]
MTKKDICIIIPALNEEKSIPLVLKNIETQRVEEIIVCDNGSIDETAAIAQKAGATVVYEPHRGYGAACLKGLESMGDYRSKIIAFIDADYSDNPLELTELYQKIDEGYDLVIGSRMRGRKQKGALPLHAQFGNWLSCQLLDMFYNGRGVFSDLGPMRVIRGEKLYQMGMSDRNFGWTIEMQIKALKKGYRCCEVPVSYKKRIGKSKISGTILGSLKAGFIILKSFWKYR